LNRSRGSRGGDNEALRQHPTDQLIRNLIAQGRAPSDAETVDIIDRLSTAQFDSRVVSVPETVRPHAPQGVPRWDALSLHLAQRAAVDSQWATGVTADMFVGDLQAAARHPSARIAIYEARGAPIALVVADTSDVVPAEHLGAHPEPLLVVVYSADWGVIVSGYQASSFDRIRIGDNALWLR